MRLNPGEVAVGPASFVKLLVAASQRETFGLRVDFARPAVRLLFLDHPSGMSFRETREKAWGASDLR